MTQPIFDAKFFTVWLGQFLSRLPMLLVLLVACIVVLVKWRQIPGKAGWALAGFGLDLALAFLVPFVQVSLQRWMLAAHTPAASVGLIFGAFTLSISLVHALSCIFLLVAIFAGHPSSPPPLPPPGSSTYPPSR